MYVLGPDGLCTNYQCTNEAICVERDGRAACVCPVCPDNFDPVSIITDNIRCELWYNALHLTLKYVAENL